MPLASVMPLLFSSCLAMSTNTLEAASLEQRSIHHTLWGLYKTRFDLAFVTADEESHAFADYEAKLAAAAKWETGADFVTCTDCYQIHQGQPGDCSSLFGCNHNLCDFCTNQPSCADCYQIHQGQKGSCCAIAGCDSKLCDFCTNQDHSPESCPPAPAPSPPSPPPSPTPTGCPGGTLDACIKQCPTDPAAYKQCVTDCATNCPSK